MTRALLKDAADALENYRRELNDPIACDIEKALRAALAQPERKPLTASQFTEIAHRTASNYTHRSDPAFIAYTFLPHTLADFVRKIEQAHGIKEAINDRP